VATVQETTGRQATDRTLMANTEVRRGRTRGRIRGDQESSFAMNAPCQVWYQTAPLAAFTDTIPAPLPPTVVSIE